MKHLLTLAVIALLGFSSVLGQNGCPSTAGQAAFINSTADLATYNPCTSLTGLVFGGSFSSQNISLPNLQSIGRVVSDVGFGIVVQSTNLVSISLPALVNFDSDQFRLIDNSQLATFSAPSAITVTAKSNVEVVFQNNPALVDFTIGFNTLGSSGSITVGGGTVQGLDGAAGTLRFPNLATVGSDIRINNNGITGGSKASLNIQMPVLTSANSLRLVNNSISAINVGAASGVQTQDTFAVTGNIALNNFNVLLASTPNILFSGNGATGGNNYDIKLDLLTRSGSGIEFSNNIGLTTISMAKLLYADGPLNIQGNAQLTTLSLPGGIINNQGGVTVNNNGNSGSGIAGVIGVQNVTYDTLSVTNNKFTSLTFPQLLYVYNTFSLTGNTFSPSVSFPTSFYAATSILVDSNTANVIDLSGLVGSPSVVVTNNVGTGSSPVIKFAQLYNTPNLNIATNRIFTDFIIGGLGYVGSLGSNNQNSISYTPGASSPSGNNLAITGNPDVLRIRTSAANNNAWSAQNILIGSNNALTTVDLSGLVQVAYLEVDASTSTNVLANVTANDLTCAGQVIVSAGQSTNNLRTTSFNKLSRATIFNVAQAESSCNSNFPSVGSISCTQACATCVSVQSVTCPSSNSPLPNLLCGGSSSNSGNPLSASTCVIPSFVVPTFSGQTLTPNTVPSNTGTGTGNGNTGTGTGNNGNNNGNTGTGTGNNGAGGRTVTGTGNNNGNNGNGSNNGASSVVMSVAVIVAVALFFM